MTLLKVNAHLAITLTVCHRLTLLCHNQLTVSHLMLLCPPKERCRVLIVAGNAVSFDSVIVVKSLNKKQLDCNTKKLKCAEKKVTATRKKLLTAKEHCKQFASLAQERQKDSRLAHLNAERKESAIRAELDNAQRRINDITADVHDRIIEEQASNSAQAKSKAASAKKRHQKEFNRQQMECDNAINQMQLSMKDNEKKALGVQKRQAAK